MNYHRIYRVIVAVVIVIFATCSVDNPALAQPAGKSCPSFDDASNTETLKFGNEFTAAFCGLDDLSSPAVGTTFTGSHRGYFSLFFRDGILVINNVNTDGSLGFSTGFSVNYGANVSNVTLAGAMYSRGTQVLLDNATPYSETLQFDFGGKTFQFDIIKSANSNVIQGFTVQEFSITASTVAITATDETRGPFTATFTFPNRSMGLRLATLALAMARHRLLLEPMATLSLRR